MLEKSEHRPALTEVELGIMSTEISTKSAKNLIKMSVNLEPKEVPDVEDQSSG
jgi:hypothetical protein